ncbi:MAG: DUF4925 domain-containing protein [Muribaculaceae bacterium]
MKKLIFSRIPIVIAILLSLVVVSCGKDEPGKGGSAESYLSGVYSSGSLTNRLEMSLNEVAIVDKEVKFQTSDNKTATITLNNVIPNKPTTVISGVVLTSPAEKTHLVFSGSQTLSPTRELTYSGSITMGLLILDLKEK